MITACKRSLRRLCFYTCLSFCSQRGVSASVHAGIHTPPWEQTFPRSRNPPGADTLMGSRNPPGSRQPQSRPSRGRNPPGSRHPRSRHPPGEQKAPWEQTPPWSRNHPGADTPLGADTLPEQTPQEQTPPARGADTPRSRHPPPQEQCMLGDTAISVSLLPSTYFVISMSDTSRNPTQTDSFKLLYSQELKIIHLCRYRHSPCKLLSK